MENTQQILQQQEESFDYKALFFKLYKYWYFFILTVFIALLIAFLFNKYTKPVYEVNTTLLIKDDRGGSMDAQAMMGFGFRNSQQNIENEIGKLQSYTLVNEAVRELDLGVAYFQEENFVTSELYGNCPFKIVIDSSFPQPVNIKFKLKILSNSNYSLEVEGKEVKLYNFRDFELIKDPALMFNENISIDSVFNFGQVLQSNLYSFKVEITEFYNPQIHNDQNFYFVFSEIDKLTKQFQSFEIDPIKDESSILKISLKANNVQKSIDFLNKMTDVYLRRNLEQKNRVADNTILFIDRELNEISDSLNLVEQDLQDFRSTKQIMNLDLQANQVFEQLKQFENERAQLDMKAQYYKTLQQYIYQNKDLENVLIIPATMGIDDPLLTKLTSELSGYYAEREEMLYYSNPGSPGIEAIDKKIEMTESTLLENINNIIKTSNITIRDINQRIEVLEVKINQLPATQRELLGIERKFRLSDNMYNYLQQKRSEAQITKASNEPDNEIIDIARGSGGTPVFPKKSLNYMIALVLGLVLPVVYILGKDYFNDKIVEKKDVEGITKFPIIGHIIHSNRDTQAVVAESPKSSISESFRSIRTNIQFLSKGKEKQTVLITSDMVSAGKTFCAINLASIFALYGKKTLLIGFDLRKPKIYRDFGLTNTEGISSYLINKSKLEDIIQVSPIENLDIIMAGPVPPNPSELIASEKTEKLFAELNKIYDYIIIDTPPVGLVTDAFLLMKYTDANIFVVRQNFTNKKMFASIMSDIELRQYSQCQHHDQ